jgi:hypothetical protein
MLFIAGLSIAIYAQDEIRSQTTEITLNRYQGYIMINEFIGGIGLGDTKPAYAGGFFGLTTIHGYQINNEFIVGAGTGISFYNGGTLVPLFLHGRYRVFINRITPYLFGDGGLMLDFSGKKDTRVFINPGIGASYTIKPHLAVDLGMGMFVQFGKVRDSYVSIKTGVVYKF